MQFCRLLGEPIAQPLRSLDTCTFMPVDGKHILRKTNPKCFFLQFQRLLSSFNAFRFKVPSKKLNLIGRIKSEGSVSHNLTPAVGVEVETSLWKGKGALNR